MPAARREPNRLPYTGDRDFGHGPKAIKAAIHHLFQPFSFGDSAVVASLPQSSRLASARVHAPPPEAKRPAP